MKKIPRMDIGRCNLLIIVLMAAVLLVFSTPALAGFHVSDGQLLDGNGHPFIMRGVNYPYEWYKYSINTEQAISDMAGIRVNAVRVVLGNGEQWGPTPASEVATVIQQLKANKMIAVLEVHDVTGYPEKQEAAHLSTAVDYWISIKNALVGQEDYVIINIGNEPLGNSVAQSVWSEVHIDAIKRLRAAGFTHTLMVDAANWGQDWEQIMLKDAPKVFAADALANIVFSVHMYQIYGQRSTIDNYISTFVNIHRLPLVVGEFGADHQGQDVDEASILELANTYQIGYLGWSWSGNSGGTESLDITISFNVNNLSPWGDFLINSAYGIRNTAIPATIFTGGEPEPPPVPVPTATPAPTPAPECQVKYDMNQWSDGFTAAVTVINNGRQDIVDWALTWTFVNGQEVADAWNANVTQSGNEVRAYCPVSHFNGTIPANGGSVEFGLQATHAGSNPIPTDFKINGVACNQQNPPGPTPVPTPIPTPVPTPEPTPGPTPVPATPTPDPGTGGCDGGSIPGGCGT